MIGCHVLKYETSSYQWSSGLTDEIIPNGYQTILQFYQEGSLVSFGRSESLLTTSSTLSLNPNKRFPHGFMFPIVGLEIIKEYKYFIFKDYFNIIDPSMYIMSDMDGNVPDMISGHCKTFRIKIESIPKIFDIIIIGRFPDVLRTKPRLIMNSLTYDKVNDIDEENISQEIDVWSTECIEQLMLSTQPGIFLLTVDGIKETIKNHTKKRNLRVLKKTKEQELDELFDTYVYKTEDQKEIEKNKKNGIMRSDILGKLGDDEDELQEMFQSKEILVLDEDLLTIKNPIDITFTINSNIEWIISGDPNLQSKIKIILLPSFETKQIIENERNKKDFVYNIQNPIFGTDGNYELTLTAARSWMSHKITLYPGQYYLFVDLSFNLKYNEILKLIMPPDSAISQYPWFEKRNLTNPSIQCQMSSKGKFFLQNRLINEIPEMNIDFNELIVNNEINTFIIEKQSDVSSKNLLNMLTRLQEQAVLLKLSYNTMKNQIYENLEFVRKEKHKLISGKL